MMRFNPLHLDMVSWYFVDLRHKVRSRQEFMNLSDRQLRDIGVTSTQNARTEMPRPFWMA